MGTPKGSNNKTNGQTNGTGEHQAQATGADFAAAGELAAETLRGDVRDNLLREFKAMQKPWAQMNETEQERIIWRAGDIAALVVNRAVEIAAHRGAPHLIAEVAQFTVKDGLKLQLSASATVDNIMQLAEHHGAAVLVLVDPAKYRGERKKAEPEVVGDLAIPKTAEAENEANLQKLQNTLEQNGPPTVDLPHEDTSEQPFAPPEAVADAAAAQF